MKKLTDNPTHIQAKIQELETGLQEELRAKSELESKLTAAESSQAQETAELTGRLATLAKELALEQKRSEALEVGWPRNCLLFFVKFFS